MFGFIVLNGVEGYNERDVIETAPSSGCKMIF